MASNNASKTCDAEGDACKKDVQALCYHCSKNLCRIHLMQHVQLIEEKTRAELNSLVDKFNGLSLRFNDLSISDDILQKPLVQLENWRADCHRRIDLIVENKRQQINDELEKYRQVFLTKNEEQLVKLNVNKKMIAELIQEADVSSTQIADLQRSIDEAEKYLDSLSAPVINVTAHPLNWSVNISTNFSEAQPISADRIRRLKITYVRLNGIIRNYYIKTKENGKMTDLVKSFIRHYTVVEEFTQLETNQICTVGHLPKPDFILPVEVYNHCVHLQYNETTSLSDILEDDIIVFYETPHSVTAENSPHILMLCLFQHKTDKQPFGLPIFLNVPRKGCRGQDVRNALHETLGNFFRLNLNSEQPLYDSCLQLNENYNQKTTKLTKLDDTLHDEIDFNKVNATLIVTFNSQLVVAYERSYLGQLGF